ncbi:ABC transporter permease [bacterium]|nr:ABC transporter permease [bacterium]
MNQTRLVWTVAGWEFRRFFKLRDQLLSLLVGVGIGLAFYGVTKLINRGDAAPVRLAVMHGESLPLTPAPGSRLRLEAARERGEPELRDAVARRAIDGLLILDGLERAELIVPREPPWRAELFELLTAARRQAALQAAALSPADLAHILAPVDLTVSFQDSGARPSSKAAKLTAGILIGLMISAIYLGFAYFFTAITGEKQLRVTEQVVSAIRPQTWIDGKLLGITATAFLGTIGFGLTVVITVLVPRLLAGQPLALPTLEPAATLLFALFSILGVLFWNCFFAAVAATINDPNTSSRSTVMLLPFIPVALAFFALGKPDSPILRILSVLPGTSSAVLPARLVLGSVPAVEIVLALLLLAGGIVLLRRLAGRIFAVAMLMYGKEPSWREILRWAREARDV